MVFNVTILGSNSAVPTLMRNPTAQLLNHNENYFLIDCAEGTQLQLRRYKFKLQRIQHIFISHMHGDHFFGLIGLISTMHLLGRKKPLHVYGPADLKRVIDLQLEVSDTTLCYPFHFHEIPFGESQLIFENQWLMVSTIPLKHSIPANGFLFREKTGRRRLKKDVIKEYNLSPEQIFNLKNGEDIQNDNGETIQNDLLTLPPHPVRSYAYCSDTARSPEIVPVIRNAGLLYHEATFEHTMADVAEEKKHSTARQAAETARDAKVAKLIIGHFSNRYSDPEILKTEASKVFPETDLALDGRTFEIPADRV
ncbi:MAG: ribonuclease Z [Bacteroidales bacterium]